MVTVISDQLLKDLNEGRVIDIEVSGLGFSLASEKWVKKQERLGNIRKEDDKNGSSKKV